MQFEMGSQNGSQQAAGSGSWCIYGTASHISLIAVTHSLANSAQTMPKRVRYGKPNKFAVQNGVA